MRLLTTVTHCDGPTGFENTARLTGFDFKLHHWNEIKTFTPGCNMITFFRILEPIS
jgi:hypothetical protein